MCLKSSRILLKPISTPILSLFSGVRHLRSHHSLFQHRGVVLPDQAHRGRTIRGSQMRQRSLSSRVINRCPEPPWRHCQVRVVTIIDDGPIKIIDARLHGWTRYRWLLLRRVW